eukprot:64748-Alexandrium_andersonii.AAC.1
MDYAPEALSQSCLNSKVPKVPELLQRQIPEIRKSPEHAMLLNLWIVLKSGGPRRPAPEGQQRLQQFAAFAT